MILIKHTVRDLGASLYSFALGERAGREIHVMYLILADRLVYKLGNDLFKITVCDLMAGIGVLGESYRMYPLKSSLERCADRL